MTDDRRDTQQFDRPREKHSPRETLLSVYEAMQEKGYDPVNQIVGYLLSGDPTYITSYKNARYLISRMERDELLEELVRSYVEVKGK
ncbi:MAG: IreB family regulatory phosphoprotein [Eubacteriales bacterium]|nr:IreB family regulatory phosphoprotein [Eubacteriales bacterium]